MMATNQFIQKTSIAANWINGSHRIYLGLKAIANEIVVMIIVSISVIPLFLVLRYLRSVIEKASDFSKIEFSKDGYKEFREDYDRLSLVVERLRESSNLKPSNVPWLLKGLVSEIFKINTAVVNYHQGMKKALDSLDEPVNRNKLFKPIPEKELWHRRTKVYDYLA